MKVQGRDCTLTLAKDGEYYPLPYSEETVRTASKGYALPGVIGLRSREKLVENGKAITGCVVTRLIISRKSGQKIPKIANLQYYKSKANYGTKKKGISR